MRSIELCAGQGGGILGDLILGHRVLCAVECDPFAQRVLRARQRDGILPWFPILDDVRTFDGAPWRGVVDVVAGGIPCQGFSGAGKRLGEHDPRNLWPDALRILRETRAPWFFLENVDRLASLDYWGVILQDLAAAGYDARWCVLSAGDVGAPHLRRRVWLLATDTDAFRQQLREQPRRSGRPGRSDEAQPAEHGEAWAVAEAFAGSSGAARGAEPGLGRVADGVADRLDRSGWWDVERGLPRVAGHSADGADRLRGLGNGQVAIARAVAWRLLGGP